MSPKLRDILCFSILLGSALVSSLEMDSLDAQQVHDMVEDPAKTKEQKIALAEEMVQSLPTEQKDKVLRVIKDLINAFVEGITHTVREFADILMNAKQQKLEAVQNMKPMKRQAGQSHSSESNSVSSESKETKP